MFMSTKELLQRIFDVYEAPAAPFPGGADDPRMLQQRVKTRVLEVLKKWVEEFSADFKAGCEAREVLDVWIAQQAKGKRAHNALVSLCLCAAADQRLFVSIWRVQN
jgi:hypothetical protein